VGAAATTAAALAGCAIGAVGPRSARGNAACSAGSPTATGSTITAGFTRTAAAAAAIRRGSRIARSAWADETQTAAAANPDVASAAVAAARAAPRKREEGLCRRGRQCAGQADQRRRRQQRNPQPQPIFDSNAHAPKTPRIQQKF
jgi:hypothetical protein